MKYGFVLNGGDIPLLPEIAAETEAAGWDGLFIADAIGVGGAGNPCITRTIGNTVIAIFSDRACLHSP